MTIKLKLKVLKFLGIQPSYFVKLKIRKQPHLEEVCSKNRLRDRLHDRLRGCHRDDRSGDRSGDRLRGGHRDDRSGGRRNDRRNDLHDDIRGGHFHRKSMDQRNRQ